jgi:hypothetical protein
MRPKHEWLVERMTDAMWGMGNNQRSVTDPVRMEAVLQVVIDELRSQPRSVDDLGALAWAALYLEERLKEERL